MVCIVIYSKKRILGYAFIAMIIFCGLGADIYKAFDANMVVEADILDPGFMNSDFYFRP